MRRLLFPAFALVGKPFSTENYGIGLKKGDTAFRSYLNDVIEASYKDGSWKKAVESTIGKGGIVTPAPPKVDRYAAARSIGPARILQESVPSMTIVFDHLPELWHGLVKTLGLTFFGFLIGSVIGVVIAVCRVSPIRPLRTVGAVYVGLMVNSPLLFLMVVAFYGVPKLGLLVNGYRTAVVAIGLYVGGYVAEALRAGINTVPNGQAEAARSIGLTFSQTLRHIVLPQAVRSSVGPMGVLLNATYRNVAVAGAIGVIEFVKAGRDISEQTAQAVPFFLAQFVVFAVLGLSTSYGAQWLDHRVAVKR